MNFKIEMPNNRAAECRDCRFVYDYGLAEDHQRHLEIHEEWARSVARHGGPLPWPEVMELNERAYGTDGSMELRIEAEWHRSLWRSVNQSKSSEHLGLKPFAALFPERGWD